MRRLVLLASVAAIILPGVAHAGKHGYAPPQVTTTFGSETLAGYGGFVPSACLSGALTKISETNGSSAPSSDFVVNTDYDGTTGQIVPTGTYGAAGPTYNGPYTFLLSGTGGECAVKINIVANESTVKSQFGFATHADTNSAFQLETVISSSSNIHLGDTVLIRNGSGSTGLTPSYNPTAALAYGITFPSGGWTGSGRITVTSETQTTGTDANDNPVYSGGAQIGPIKFDSNTMGDVGSPIDFKYVALYTDAASPAQAQLVTYSNHAHGINFYNFTVENGPDVTIPASINGISYSYNGTDSSGAQNITVENGYFYRMGIGLLAVVASGATEVPGGTISNNYFINFFQRGFQIDKAAPWSVVNNTFIGGHGSGGGHSDTVLMVGTSVGYSGAGPTFTGNILVHGPAGLTAVNSVNYASASGAVISNGTYTQIQSSGGTGLYAYLDLTISGCPGACVYSAVPTAFSGGGTQGGGRGYLVGDVISVVESTITVNFTVTSLTYSPDSLGIFDAGGGTDTLSSFTAKNNIISLADSDNIVISDANGVAINYNDVPGDFVSDPPGANPSLVSGTGGAGGSFDRNTANSFSVSGQSGSPTCYPGTPSQTPACASSIVTAGSLSAYQAVWPNFTTTPALYNRAAFILSQAPLLGGSGENPDGTYRTALFPIDSHGVISWNDGTVFVFTATHTPAQ